MSLMAIKIECGCGQHYAFEVEPLGGQMPAPVACPACGADGTAMANQIISGNLALPRAGPRIASSTTSAPRPPGPRTSPRRGPLNDDAARDLIEAKENIKRATSAAVIVAGWNLVYAIMALCGVGIPGVDARILVDVGIIAALAYGIHRHSRTCAVLMFIYYLGVYVALLGKIGIIFIVVRGALLYFFGRGAQGAFTYHKLNKRRQ